MTLRLCYRENVSQPRNNQSASCTKELTIQYEFAETLSEKQVINNVMQWS